MANFPTFPFRKESRDEAIDDITVDSAVAGNARVRTLYTAAKRRFVCRFLLNAADWTTFLAFYNANRDTTFSFLWGDGVTYTAVFTAPWKRSLKGALSEIELVIRQV